MPDPVSSSLAAGASATATTTVTFTAQPAGTLLVLSVAADDYITTSGANRPESSSWTPVQLIGGSGQYHGSYMWMKKSTGSETSVAYTIGSASRSAYVLSAHTNIDQTTPLDTSAQQQNNTTGSTYTTPAATPSAGRKLALAHLSGSNSGALYTGVDTWLNGYTEVAEGLTTANPGLALGQAVLVLDGGVSTSSGCSFQPNTGPPQARAGILAVFNVAAAGSLAANATDTVGVTDSAAAAQAFVRTAVDPVGVTDGATTAQAFLRAFGDAIGVTDSGSFTIGSGSPWALVEAVDAPAPSTTVTSLTATTTTPIAAGETLVAIVGHTDDFPATPAGWDKRREIVTTGVMSVFTRAADGSEGSTVTFTAPSAGGMGLRLLRYTGLGAFQGAATGQSESSGTFNTGNLTTAAADVLLIAAGHVHAGTLPAGDVTPSSGWTLVRPDSKSTNSGNKSQINTATQTVNTTGTYTYTGTYTPAVATKNESILIGFAIVVPASLTATATDPVGGTDSFSTAQGVARAATDTVGVTDSATFLSGFALSFSATDAVGLTDTAGPQSIDAAADFTDPVGVTDSATFGVAVSQTSTDPVGVTDSITAGRGFDRSATDAVGLADAAAVTQDLARAAADPVSVTDSASFTVTGIGSVSATDLLGVTDSAAAAQGFARVLTDLVGATDSWSAGQDFSRPTTDPVGVSDSASFVIGFVISQPDPVGIVDTATFVVEQGVVQITAVDQVGVADGLATTVAAQRTLLDQLAVSDRATFVLNGNYTAAVNPNAKLRGPKRIKRGDTLPSLVIDLSGDAGPVDLTAATQIKVLGVRDGSVAVNRSADGDAAGAVTMDWTTETAAAGLIGFEVEVTWPGGKKQTFPADGLVYAEVTPDLG